MYNDNRIEIQLKNLNVFLYFFIDLILMILGIIKLKKIIRKTIYINVDYQNEK